MPLSVSAPALRSWEALPCPVPFNSPLTTCSFAPLLMSAHPSPSPLSPLRAAASDSSSSAAAASTARYHLARPPTAYVDGANTDAVGSDDAGDEQKTALIETSRPPRKGGKALMRAAATSTAAGTRRTARWLNRKLHPTKAEAIEFASNRVPLVRTVMTYKWREYLFGDLIAGLSIATILIPQSIAYATVAGLPPVYGLYASFVPMSMYALFGTCQQLNVAPVSILYGRASAHSAYAVVGADEGVRTHLLWACAVDQVARRRANHQPDRDVQGQPGRVHPDRHLPLPRLWHHPGMFRFKISAMQSGRH